MIARLFSYALHGIDAFKVVVEVSLSGKGIGTVITGLPDDAIKASLSRIDAAIHACGYHMPRTRLVINLIPASIRKWGTCFDLPITLGILLASEQIDDCGQLSEYIFAGEIGLEGSIHPVRGAISMAICAKKVGCKGVVLPTLNAKDAAIVSEVKAYGIEHLKEAVSFIASDAGLSPHVAGRTIETAAAQPDFKDVKGQYNVKRALEIAAAGGHNTLIIGPPGVGKTMLAKRISGILPAMNRDEALESFQICSLANNQHTLRQNGISYQRPFRSPHHTISDSGLAGGGSFPTPGEISMAHNGILFLDELPEFKRAAIEVLRQPLEEGKVNIARARVSMEFPAKFMLVASMNACPCGYLGHPSRKCYCSKRAILWYRRKISGPLLDRIDLHVEAEPTSFQDLAALDTKEESSAIIRQRVINARTIQEKRFHENAGTHCNAQLPDHLLSHFCTVEPHAMKFLLKAMTDMQLSSRAYSRILKLARTIADLAGANQIELNHVAEAIHFRYLDKPLPIDGFITNKQTKKYYYVKDSFNL